MTVEEAIARANDPGHQDSNTPAVRQWLLGALPQDICRFIHGLSVGGNERYLPAARASLDVRLSEDTAKQAETLRQQVATLVGIAEAQRVLAAKLDGQTDTLIRLTRWLKWLTVWLLILTVALCGFETYHFVESRQARKIGVGQSSEPAGRVNGSQPIRSETNSASQAAGSRHSP